jgi:hypothetical protein
VLFHARRPIAAVEELTELSDEEAIAKAHALFSERKHFSKASSGAVTPTWIGAARALKGPLNFRPRSGSPRPESVFSEDAERAAGCEMALDVKRVLDGGVNR